MKLNKSFSAIIGVVLALTLCITTCTSAFAATFNGKKYVKETILSYGNTAEEAKKWLTDNDYEIVDNNLNAGADDAFSTKRAVYLGYKTTDKADEAITDMKLMNMKGGYSVQDYQMLLSEQKTNIKLFFDDFKSAIMEYRANYKANQQRAVTAHDMLNMLYDDDTKQNLGDLLLNKVREEYTDEQYETLSDDEKAQVADMTTILMQGNATAILAMEQFISMATGDESPWANRYKDAKTYDEMIDELMDKDDLTVEQAVKELAAEYDDDAKKIATNFENYKSFIETYTNADITLDSTTEEIEAYEKANEDFSTSDWITAGTQYEVIKALENDGVSLYDLIFGNDFDVENDDRYMLYPLVSILSDGQRACLDYISTYQLVAIGINDDSAVKSAFDKVDVKSVDSLQNVSVYDGIDREIFGDDVALTGEAYKLQNSTGQNPTETWVDSISCTSLVLIASFAVSMAASVYCWYSSSSMTQLSNRLASKATSMIEKVNDLESSFVEAKNLGEMEKAAELEKSWKSLDSKYENLIANSNSADGFARLFTYVGLATTCLTIVLMVVSLWSSFSDLEAFYNVEFTPIPSNMVNQSIDENDKKVYTYYKAVKCNRVQQKMVTDKTKLLEDFGDLNGDVGKQWVALYTTKDKAAGNPITADFTVQIGNSDLPNDSTALSIFCESVAQNLTNKKAGYTYADSKGGIYLFYGTDENAFAGSAISNGTYALITGGVAIVVAVAAYFFGRYTEKKKQKKDNATV